LLGKKINKEKEVIYSSKDVGFFRAFRKTNLKN